MNNRLQISVIGGSDPTGTVERSAEEVGRRLAEAGAVVVCGGMGGVMEAACRGAKAAGGTTVGILPTYQVERANPYCDIVIPSGLGLARNMLVVAAGRAVIAIDGRYGTLSEMALALNLGRPVVSLNSWILPPPPLKGGSLPTLHRAKTPREAVETALRLAGVNPV